MIPAISTKVTPSSQKSSERSGENSSAEGRVGEPTAVGHRPGQQAPVQQDAAGQVHPVAEGVEAGERHVARADLQRRQVHGEPFEHRHGEEEHHRRAVHGEDLVVGLRRQERALRGGELDADEQTLDAADGEEHQGGPDEPHADLLVVHRAEEAGQAALGRPRQLEVAQGLLVGPRRSHVAHSRPSR
jgi:hypothetical protein